MIRAVAKSGDKKLIILGVDDRNIEALTHGKPIHVEGAMLGFPDIAIVIVHGHTYQDIADEFKKAGIELPVDRVPDVQPGEAIVFKRKA